MIIAVFGSLDFDVVFSLAPSINPTLITIICILLFIGAGAKSAVLGLHSWLPGSMEAQSTNFFIVLRFLIVLQILSLFILPLIIFNLKKIKIFFNLIILKLYALNYIN
jgi:formate hydrogenlyase subunit 3/multisubunit Na+/H+ antiporter MnhD subunit